MNQTLSVAQIGLGYWGPNLLRNLVSNRSFRVSKVVDMSEERRAFGSSLYPAVRFTDNADEVFDDDEIEAVVIATPVLTHYELARKALLSGKHILVEKPMAMTVEDVRKLRDLAKERNLVAMVGHTFLYNPYVRYLKKMIEDGDLGEIRYIYSQRLNLGRIRSDVDALWNFAPHDISIIQYLLDEPNPFSVWRHGMSYIQNGLDDVVFLNITYPNRVIASIHVSWLDPQKVRRITIVGSKKMVVYDDVADYKIAIFDKGIEPKAKLGVKMDYDDPRSVTYDHRSGDVLFPQVKWQEPLQNEVEHFFDCIRNGTKCMTDAEHAMKVVQIIENAHSAGLPEIFDTVAFDSREVS